MSSAFNLYPKPINKILVIISIFFLGSNCQLFTRENLTHEIYQNTKRVEILPAAYIVNNCILDEEGKTSKQIDNFYVISRQTQFSNTLKNKLDTLIHNYSTGQTDVSYTIYNILTKEHLQFKGDNPKTAASSFKTYLATYIFYLIENNKLSKQLIHQIADSINCKKLENYIDNIYSKNPQKKFNDLQYFANGLENIELCKMLFISDNDATQKMIKLLPDGLRGLNNFIYNTLGMKHSFINNWKNLKNANINTINLHYGYANTLTTNDQVEAWRKIFVEEIIIKDSKLLNKLIDLLSFSYLHPLDKYIKKSHYIMSKHGKIDYEFWGGANPHACFNEGGIIFGQQGYPKYIIQIQISDPPTIVKASEFVSQFSEVVWNYFISKKFLTQQYVAPTLFKKKSGPKNLFSINTDAPTIVSAQSRSNNRIDLVFNKKVKKITAENINNYLIKSLGISNPVLHNDRKTVSITTTNQKDTIYSVKVQNIQDIGGILLESFQTVNFVGIKEKNIFSSGLYAENSYYHTGYGPIITILYKNRLEGFFSYCYSKYNSDKIGYDLRKNELNIGLEYWVIRKELTEDNGVNIGFWSTAGIENFGVDNRKISESWQIYYGICGNYNYRANTRWIVKPNLKIAYLSYFVDDSYLEDKYDFIGINKKYFYSYGLTFIYKMKNDNSLFFKYIKFNDYQPSVGFDNTFQCNRFKVEYKIVF